MLIFVAFCLYYRYLFIFSDMFASYLYLLICIVIYLYVGHLFICFIHCFFFVVHPLLNKVYYITYIMHNMHNNPLTLVALLTPLRVRLQGTLDPWTPAAPHPGGGAGPRGSRHGL